nr:hypothetical protein [Tanacetum cinerariifolium]
GDEEKKESFDEDVDDEAGDDDDDDDDEDDDAEEEHLSPADSSAIHAADPVPSVGDTKAFKTYETAPTPPSPQTQVARLLALPTPPLSSLTPLSSLLPQIPLPPLPVPSLPLPLPPHTTSPTYDGFLEAEMPPRKRACLATPAPKLEVRESLAAGTARRQRPALEADLRQNRVREMGYGITDTWDEIVEAIQEDTDKYYVRFQDAQDDQAFLRARVNTLFRDRPYHHRTTMLLEREATYARRAWTGFKDMSAAIEAHVRILESQKTPPNKRTTRETPATTTTTITSPITDAQLRALIARGVATALAERNADKSRNGDDNHSSGTGGRRCGS